ncbi:MAG: adenosylcobinamide-GDP ribazoletransferase [Dehalococcoidia bacterium]
MPVQSRQEEAATTGSGLLTPFWLALGFLSLIPTPRLDNPPAQAISDSRAYYPVVGLLLGALLLGVEQGASRIFPVPLTAALLLVALALVTRGLHLDGFMDICDGLFGGYTPERRLEIMKDSHVGAFAVVGAVSLLILKYAALVSLLSLPGTGKLWALLLFPVVSRWSMVLLLGVFPYVRSQGLGSPFHQGGHRVATSVAVVVAVGASALLGSIGGLAILAGVSLLAWGLGWAMSRMLGGLVGDAYGAANEVAEVFALGAAVVLVPYGLIAPPFQLVSF